MNMKTESVQSKKNKVLIIFIAYLVFFYVLDLLDIWSKFKNLVFIK